MWFNKIGDDSVKVIVVDEKTKTTRINYFIDWLVHMVGYALVLISVMNQIIDAIIDNNIRKR